MIDPGERSLHYTGNFRFWVDQYKNKVGELYLEGVVKRFDENYNGGEGRWVLNRCRYTLTVRAEDLELIQTKIQRENAALAQAALEKIKALEKELEAVKEQLQAPDEEVCSEQVVAN